MSRAVSLGPVTVSVGAFQALRRLDLDVGARVSVSIVFWRKGKRRL